MTRFLNLYKYFIVAKSIYLKKIVDLFPFYRHESYTKFIILSQPRVGSTLLLSYLNYHPQIIVKGEILREKKSNLALEPLSMIEYLEKEVYRRYSKTIEAVGFKYFYEHQIADRNFFNYLSSKKDLKIIHLKRKNLLRSFVSTKIAKATGVWSQTSFDKDLTLVENSFKKNSIYNVFYEDLINNKIYHLSKIQSFLNVKETILRSILKKQNPEKLKDLIINFKEISHLEGIDKGIIF